MPVRASRFPIVIIICVALLPAIVSAQNAPAAPEQQQNRQLAVDIVRIINAAELYYRTQHNRFATIDELRKSGAFPKSDNNSQAAKALAAAVGPDIGGFYLRLFTSPDGSQYALSLHDEKDQSLWSVFSNEKMLIYTGAVIQ